MNRKWTDGKCEMLVLQLSLSLHDISWFVKNRFCVCPGDMKTRADSSERFFFLLFSQGLPVAMLGFLNNNRKKKEGVLFREARKRTVAPWVSPGQHGGRPSRVYTPTALREYTGWRVFVNHLLPR